VTGGDPCPCVDLNGFDLDESVVEQLSQTYLSEDAILDSSGDIVRHGVLGVGIEPSGDVFVLEPGSPIEVLWAIVSLIENPDELFVVVYSMPDSVPDEASSVTGPGSGYRWLFNTSDACIDEASSRSISNS
jgi:hypothetical protein